MMKRNDWLLMGAVLLAAALWWGFTEWQSRSGAATQVLVWQDRQLIGTYPLNSPDTLDIPADTDGGHNLIRIENGTVRMVEADCPDQVCVHTQAIRGPGQSIVCLPNRIMVEVAGDNPQEVQIDDISQ